MSQWRRCLAVAWLYFLLPSAQAASPVCPAGTALLLGHLGEVALARAEWVVAAREFACAALRSDDASLAERATRNAFDYHQHEWARISAMRWLELDAGSEVARRYLAISLLRQYRDAAAAAEFDTLLATAYPDRAQGYTALLGILVEERNVTGAARVIEQLAAGDDGVAEAHYAASVLWQRAEHGARARAAAQRALQLRPGWRMAELAEVRALLTLGLKDQALSRSAALAADGDPYTRLNHAWLLGGNDRADEAAAVFNGLRRENRAQAEAMEGLGALALDQHRYEDASQLFTELARNARNNETAFWYMARIAEERGDRVQAVRLYERVTSGDRAVAAQLRAGRLMRELGAPERAELQLSDFLAASPGQVREVVIGQAAVLADLGEAPAAIAMLEAAARRLPDDDLRMARAYLLEREDRVVEAVAQMRAVAARRPEDPVSLNALGYTLVDRTRDVEAGHRLIARALEYKPDNYAIQDSMGWALVRLGRVTEGLVWLEKAWQRSEDPEVAVHLGEALWRLDRAAEARELWQRSLARHPDSRPLQRALERHRN